MDISGWVSHAAVGVYDSLVNVSPGSIFYFGYLAGQVPAGYFLQRLPMAKFIGFCTIGKLDI